MNKFRLLRHLTATLIAFGGAGSVMLAQSSTHSALASPVPAGPWTALNHLAPENLQLCLLLPDATVMCNGFVDHQWFRLTPDAKGSYVNGTWTTLAPMHYSRFGMQSQVLPDGRVLVSGGEGTDGNDNSEIYQPSTNTWTVLPSPFPNFLGWSDSQSALLPNGNVITSPVLYGTGIDGYNGPPPTPAGSFNITEIFDVTSNTWSTGPESTNSFGPNFGQQDESSWVVLPDQSILTIDINSTHSQRYIPSIGQWISDATAPLLWNVSEGEIGAALLLPNGSVFYAGANGKTGFHKPSGNLSPGTWTNGPNLPILNGNQLVCDDMPAAMMANGKILMVLGTAGSVGLTTAYYYEFDYTTNTFAPVVAPPGVTAAATYQTMLDLPDGSVLLQALNTQFIYKPVGRQVGAGAPHIYSVTKNADGSFHVTGTGFNGNSEGAYYGDDYQMGTNRPIARVTNNLDSNVYYARTYNWSETGVATGSKVVSTEMALPAGLPKGIYVLSISANGVGSDNLVGFYVN